MSEKFFLIDGSALYYKSYFAFIRNPLINSKGENTSATFGFLNALIRLIEEEKPDYLAIIFDTKEPTFRHEIYKEYKATREKMPEEMADQYPRLISTLKAFDFVLLEKAGYEADDIIGTLAAEFAGEERDVFIVSGDKDMAQLVNEHVFLYTPASGKKSKELMDVRGVQAKLGVHPNQVIDWLALMGDSSDNIPGVPKVGKVTAAKFLQQYGSLEKLYCNIADLKESAVKDNLIACREQTALARRLATIALDVPLDVKLENLRFRIWDMEIVKPLLRELEFNRLTDRMLNLAVQFGAAADFERHADEKVRYEIIDSEKKLSEVLAQLKKQQAFVFDLETDSLDFLSARIAGIALSWEERRACYIPLNHPDISLPAQKTLWALEPFFSDPAYKKIGQNLKFDVSILEQHGLAVRGLHFDTLIASYLLNPSAQHKLDKLAERYLNYEMIHIAELLGSGKKQKKMTELPAVDVVNYAAEDADITLRLYHHFQPLIKEMGMEKLFYDLELPLIKVLLEMERNGVKLDVDLLRQLSVELDGQVAQLQQAVFDRAGKEFNLNSPQQLGTILFDELEIHRELGLKKAPKTKTGQYSTSEKVLERYAAHPVINHILEYRQLTKLKNTYLDALPQLVHPGTGRVHTSFNQTVAATGRLSSSNPNLQNIPIRTEIGRQIRRAFIPSREDYKIVSADYSQIELRLMAHLSQDKTMIRSFKNNQDIHRATAALIFDIDEHEVSADHRRKAKEINFGIIYGMSRFGLSSRLKIPVDQAQEFIIDYMATYPGIASYMKEAVNKAREQGYVETMLQRRRYLPEIKSSDRQIREFAERTAINTPIQGSAADLIKKAMLEVQDFIIHNKIPAKMLLQVHDELVFEVHQEAVEDFMASVREIMEHSMKLSVPVIVDCGSGNNWLEAH